MAELESRERFAIENDEQAEWAIRKIKEARENAAMWKAYYAEQTRKINEANDATIIHMESLLAAYFMNVPHKQAKTQESYPLPSGKLVMKKEKLDFEVTDGLLDWLKANAPEKVRVKEEPNLAELRKAVTVAEDGVYLTETGEKIIGLKPVLKPQEFKVEGI